MASRNHADETKWQSPNKSCFKADNMREITEGGFFCVHVAARKHTMSTECRDIWCDSNETEADCCISEAEPVSNTLANGACPISLMWDKIIMSPRTNLAATNHNWSFGKTWVTGRWVRVGTAQVAAGHTNTASETLTSFSPVPVWLPRVQH